MLFIKLYYRYGVAPDHPEVKNVINQFTKVAQHPNVNYYGNVTLGKDVSLNQLRQHYHAVLLVRKNKHYLHTLKIFLIFYTLV